MRVRPPHTGSRRSARRLPLRRERPAAPSAPLEPEATPSETGPRDQAAAHREAPGLAAERRARESGGPIDLAHYSCRCGYVFNAAVSTSVTCPHCGTGQAW